MANTIDRMDVGGAPIGPERIARSTPEAPSSAPEPAQTGTDVHITDSASQLAQLEQALKALPAVDPARVAAVSRALESGSYGIDVHRIAAGLLSSEQALSPLKRSEE